MAHRFAKQSPDNWEHLDDEELDAVKTLLVSLLMKNTPLDRDEIYSYIFGEGKRIIWN
jgi:hypothetical protein